MTNIKTIMSFYIPLPYKRKSYNMSFILKWKQWIRKSTDIKTNSSKSLFNKSNCVCFPTIWTSFPIISSYFTTSLSSADTWTETAWKEGLEFSYHLSWKWRCNSLFTFESLAGFTPIVILYRTALRAILFFLRTKFSSTASKLWKGSP